MGPYNGKNFRCKIEPEYWTYITWNAFWHPPLHIHVSKWTLKFSPFLPYENSYLNLNYLKTFMASPVISSALLERNTLCYIEGKFRPAALSLRRQRPLKIRQSAKMNIFCGTVHTLWKGWRVTYSEFFGIFSLYISHVFIVHSQVSGFRYITALWAQNVARMELACAWISWPSHRAL